MENRVSLIEVVRSGVQDVCKEEYFLSDAFLMRWLKYEQMDANKAIKAFKTHLEWRSANNINSLLQEDFSEFEQFLPVDCESIDKHGRVVVKIVMQHFRLKHMKLEECKDKAIRYSLWVSEKIEKAIRAQSKRTDGRVNHAIILTDCKGVTDALKGLGWTKLPQAVRLLQEMLGQLNPNYPGSSELNCIINASGWFTKIFHLIKPFMSKETLASTQIHSTTSKFDWTCDL